MGIAIVGILVAIVIPIALYFAQQRRETRRGEQALAVEQARLAFDRERAEREAEQWRPHLSVEKSGPSGSDAGAWNGTALVQNHGGSVANSVQVQARLDGAEVGHSCTPQHVPPGGQRSFPIQISDPQQHGGHDHIEDNLILVAYDAADNQAIWYAHGPPQRE